MLLVNNQTKGILIMENKKYAQLIHLLTAEKRDFLNESEIDSNEELANLIDEYFLEHFEELSLEHIAYMNYILEGKESTEFADYVRENAEQIATRVFADVLHKLRHPKLGRQIRQFVEFPENE